MKPASSRSLYENRFTFPTKDSLTVWDWIFIIAMPKTVHSKWDVTKVLYSDTGTFFFPVVGNTLSYPTRLVGELESEYTDNLRFRNPVA